MGRLAVLGCAGIAADEFLDCAGNLEFLDIVLKWLSPSSAFNIHALRADMPESIESRIVSDMRGLAGRTRSCLQEIDELPKEFDVLLLCVSVFVSFSFSVFLFLCLIIRP